MLHCINIYATSTYTAPLNINYVHIIIRYFFLKILEGKQNYRSRLFQLHTEK